MSAGESTTELLFLPLLSPWAWVVLVVAGGAAVLLAWRSGAGLRPQRRHLLLGLRLLLLFVFAAVLTGPHRVERREHRERQPLVILVDESRSMGIRDMDGASRAEVVTGWIRDLREAPDALPEGVDLELFAFSEDLRPLAVGGELDASGSDTDLSSAFLGLREKLGDRRPAAVLVVSDGVDRGALGRAFAAEGKEGLAPFRSELGAPVSTWTLGATKDAIVDLKIVDVHAPPFGFVRRPMEVEVDVARSGLPEGPVRVQLRAEGQLLSSQDAFVGEGDSDTLTFEVRPDQVGFHTYELSLPIPEGDVIESNNRREFTVKIVRDRTRVLQVSSRPSWDVKFLRRLLKTDPNIDLVSFFILRTTDFEGELARREELSLIAFPYDELFSQDLQGFDLVIFQNFWFGSFAGFSDTHYLQNVADYVREGGALLMVGGDITGEAGYGDSPLASVLPSLLPRAGMTAGEGSLKPTEAGERHPITRGLLGRAGSRSGASPGASRLPTLGPYNDLGAVDAEGVSLLRRGDTAQDVLAVRDVGRGRSLVLASESSWRWAMGSDTVAGTDAYEELWRSVLRWLVRDAEERQVQVLTDAENYEVGDPLSGQVRVLQTDYSPLADASLVLTARSPSSPEVLLRLEGTTDSDGHFEFGYRPSEVGTLILEAEVDVLAESVARAEARVSVSDGRGELANPVPRPDLMEGLAAVNDGTAFSTEPPNLAKLPLKRREDLRLSSERAQPVWNHAFLLLLLVTLASVEWILRRRFGLR